MPSWLPHQLGENGRSTGRYYRFTCFANRKSNGTFAGCPKCNLMHLAAGMHHHSIDDLQADASTTDGERPKKKVSTITCFAQLCTGSQLTKVLI